MAAPPGLTGPVGLPTTAQHSNAAWNRLLRTLARDIPKELHRAQHARQRLARLR